MSTVVVVVISCSSCKFLVPLRHGLVKVSFVPGHTIDQSFSTLCVLGFCVPNVLVFLVSVKPSLGLLRCPLWFSSCAMPCARTFRSSAAWPDSVCFSIFTAVHRSCSLRSTSVHPGNTQLRRAPREHSSHQQWWQREVQCPLARVLRLGMSRRLFAPILLLSVLACSMLVSRLKKSLSTTPAVFCTWWEAVGRSPLFQNEVEDVGPQTHPHAQCRVRRGNHRLSTTACVPNGQLGQPCDLHLHAVSCLSPPQVVYAADGVFTRISIRVPHSYITRSSPGRIWHA